MSKNWMMLTGLLFLGSVGASQAHPLDTPDIVYIDGLPCNSACQSYMAWTRRKTTPVTEQSAPVESTPVESPAVHSAPQKPALRSAQPAQHPKAARREGPKPAVPPVAKRTAPLPAVGLAKPQPADVAVNSGPAPAEVSKPAPADVAAAPSPARKVQELVAAATALAENLTAASAATAPQRDAVNADASDQSGAAAPDNTTSKAGAATDSTDNRVALLMARSEIGKISDLAGKDVAIENQRSASSASIQAAIASAGAAEVRLDEKDVSAVDRLVGGNVPAAVLTLVSPQAAEWFPDIPGYRIFRIPVSPGSVRARL